MSYNDDLSGGFTELEIAAGIPSLVDGTDRGYLDDYEEDTSDVDNESSKNKDSKFEIDFLTKYKGPLKENSNPILHEVASCLTHEDAKYKTIQALMFDEVGYIIKRFGKREEIPKYCLDIVNDDDCLDKFVKGFLKKILKINPSTGIIKEIELISAKLLENRELETPYDRVSKIQSYIHNKARFINGIDGHKKIPRNQIRLLLATSRLHLSITDILRRDRHNLYEYFERKQKEDDFQDYIPSSYFGYLYKKAEVQARIERSYPSFLEPINGKYQPHWSVRHKKNISYYCKIRTREKIAELQRIKNSIGLLEARALCFHIYFKD
jgi:hypothetical protein